VNGGVLPEGRNPLWRAGESSFNVTQILRMLQKNGPKPRIVCEAGCEAAHLCNLFLGRAMPRALCSPVSLGKMPTRHGREGRACRQR
jgi:hypothetical protein